MSGAEAANENHNGQKIRNLNILRKDEKHSVKKGLQNLMLKTQKMSKMKMVSYEDYRKVIENVRKIGLFNKFTELEQLRQDNGMPENSLDEYILQLAEPKSPEEYERILETIEADIHNE